MGCYLKCRGSNDDKVSGDDDDDNVGSVFVVSNYKYYDDFVIQLL